MNKDILVLGKGFIGSILSKEFNCMASSRRINSYHDAQLIINMYSPKIIINCIGVVGEKNVDDCNIRDNDTMLANSYVPIILGEIAYRKDIKLVNIGSGCIFYYDYEEDSPIDECDMPDYFDLFYSRSKIYSEAALAVLSEECDILIPRIRIPLLNYPHRRNILDKLIKFKNFTDIPNSVTYIPDFIKALKHLLRINARGIYNVVNSGGLRYPKLMDVYKKYVPGFEYGIISRKKRGTVRTDLLLSTEKLKESGFPVRDINSVLDECVREYLEVKK